MTATPDALFTNNSPAGIVVSDASSPFEFEAIGAQFECTHAIYPTGGQASICYVTSEQRARLIVAALNHFKESGKLDEWMSAENTTIEARRDAVASDECSVAELPKTDR